VLRLPAEKTASLLGRAEGVCPFNRAAELSFGEELGDQFLRGPAHDGVGVSDDEVVEPRLVVFQRTDDRLGAVTGVDVGPQVPRAGGWLVLKGGEVGVLGRARPSLPLPLVTATVRAICASSGSLLSLV